MAAASPHERDAAPDRQDTPARKAALRRRMAAVREAVPLEARVAAALALAEAAPSLPLPPGTVVSAFVPMGSEIDVTPLVEALAARGHPIALPAVTGKRTLAFRIWRAGDPLVSARFGTREPAPDAPERDPDALLVPLLAFTREGYRLGYGGGFYDTALARLAAARGRPPLAIGVGYGCQEVAPADLPVEPHDVALPAVLTERGMMKTSEAGRPDCD